MKGINLQERFAAARHSRRGLWMLNRLLWAGIPFNKPHRLEIRELTEESVKVYIPFRRKNKNHLNGLHACVLATAAEYASGLVILQLADPARYRLIMRKLEVEYHYQGKTDAFVDFNLSSSQLHDELASAQKRGMPLDLPAKVEVNDNSGNLLCTATVHWQIKAWTDVRTKQ